VALNHKKWGGTKKKAEQKATISSKNNYYEKVIQNSLAGRPWVGKHGDSPSRRL
jgi:hypothetical protein